MGSKTVRRIVVAGLLGGGLALVAAWGGEPSRTLAAQNKAAGRWTDNVSATPLPAGWSLPELEAAIRALPPGTPIPPELLEALESRADLKERLPEEIRERLEEAVEAGKVPEERPREPGGLEAAIPGKEKPPAPLEAVAPPAYDWKISVYAGSLFGKRLRKEERERIVHFGHDLFAPKRLAAASLENVPVAADYVVGPGDEVIVRLWGRMEGTHRMTVDRDGKIFFPKIGSLYVAGKTFSGLQAFLKARVGTIAEVSSDVSLGKLRGIRVSVIGEVRSPGWYNVSSLHTAVQALVLAGGVKDIGSLRRIEVRRGGKVLESIDLYDLLLKGDTGADARLLQGDAVFVPVVGRLVAVAGEVRRPAIYELKGENGLLDAVRMAGGFSPAAFTRRVQVERLEGHDARTVLDVDAREVESGSLSFDLADGDIVRILPIVRADVNAVLLEGNVLRPGKYELKPGMTVGSLLPDETAFLPDTYFDYALLTRFAPPDLRREILPVNLRAIVLERRKEADVALQPYDELRVYHRSSFRDEPKATISGELRMIRRELGEAPKAEEQTTIGKVDVEAASDRNVLTFPIPEGARAADLVKMAGGLTRTASLDRAEIVRIDENRNFRTIYFDLGRAMQGDPAENHPLQEEDHVRIHSIWEGKYRKTVAISGDVRAPGEYVLTEGMRLSDLLFKAGGFRESAYAREAELVRRKVADGGSLVITEKATVSPKRALSGEADQDVPLREHDLLIIQRIPDWDEKIRVTLTGEFRFPGTYTARRGERLSSVIERAGGFTPEAYVRAAKFARVSTQKSQQEAIDRLIADLELEVAQKSQELGGVMDREDLEANKQILAARKALIEQLKKARAQGRVIIRIEDPENLKLTNADLLLEDGDTLAVPKRPTVVNVVGRVYNPTGVVFDPGNDELEHYLETVGGPTESADRDHVFLLKANGSVVTKETVKPGWFSSREEVFLGSRVEPGDSIVVPEKLVQTRLMKDVKDITQIMMQIAVTAGILIAAF